MAVINVLVCIALALAMPQITAYKILLVPIPMGSHMTLISSVAEAFLAAGHEVHVAKPHSVLIPSQYKNLGIQVVNYGKEGELHLTQTEEFATTVATLHEKGPVSNLQFLFGEMSHFCHEILTDENIHQKLAKNNYDFVLVDEMPTITCFQAIPHRLGVPYGNIWVAEPWGMLGLTLQSQFIHVTFPVLRGREQGFLIRLIQFFSIQTLQIGRSFVDVSVVKNYIKDKPLDDIEDLRRNAKIWLIDNEPMLYGAKHAPPNVINVGGISVSKLKPLPADLQKFADSAKEGLIVVSFGGSLISEFPEHILKNLLMGLGLLKQKVVIRLKFKPNYEIGKNIFIAKWLPQNDLLGHKNTVLFITHCGVSSINEAVHQGVPMIGFPNQEEQRGNGRQFETRNYGLIMDRKKFTPEDLKITVEKMMTNSTWKDAVKKASSIIKNRRATSGEEAVYWVEHVIKYGADHLTPSTVKLAWYQVMMLDIMATVLAIILIFAFILIKCCQFGMKKCCGGKSKKQKKS